ncbi:transposase [Jannaschia formosa]|nr:transposase [Jannaschia formosa]
MLVAQAEAALPALATARHLVDRFVAMGRNGTAGDLKAWFIAGATSEIASVARGLASDQAAIVAALTEPLSNGQTEGQINRLKTLKRQMYGRANIDLLKARLVAASRTGKCTNFESGQILHACSQEGSTPSLVPLHSQGDLP